MLFRSCPDGALQNFVDNIERKITAILHEMSVSDVDANNLSQKTQEITIEDMIALRNSLSEQANKELENESSPS
mgnify:CR=1 FL=1